MEELDQALLEKTDPGVPATSSTESTKTTIEDLVSFVDEVAKAVPSPEPAVSSNGIISPESQPERSAPANYSRENFESRWQVGAKNLILLLTTGDGIFKNLTREDLQSQGYSVVVPTTVEDCLAKAEDYSSRGVTPVFGSPEGRLLVPTCMPAPGQSLAQLLRRRLPREGGVSINL